MAFLELSNVRKSFGHQAAVEDFSLAVEQGEFLSFLGPSGCGKTTSLRMVAGFEMPTSGTIRIDGQDVTYVPTAKRRIGMVFQAYALFPNMTVARNIAFGLRVAGMPKPDIDRRVSEMLDLVKLAPLAGRYPAQLSGGQQQRVALARALAPRPRILLLDEPLSALDAQIRIEMRAEIRALQRTLGITTIFVTHDQEEALSLSDRIVVMSAGRIEQVGTPLEIYNAPRTRFVAGFVGTTNVLTARVVNAAAGDIEIDGQAIRASRPLNGAASLAVALRPEALRVGDALPCRLSGTAEDVAFLGSIVRVKVRLGSQTVVVDQFNARDVPPPASNAPVTLSFAPQDLSLLD
jgi:putative spermidine/putrescine transport system ATP-binding protein